MSAVAESWATDAANTIAAVNNRIKAPNGTDWKETVIQAMYGLVATKYAANGAKIVELAGATEGFTELASEGAARPWAISGLKDDADWASLETHFKPHAVFTGQPFSRLVFHEGWYFRIPAHEPAFLKALGAMTVRTSYDFLYMPWLFDSWTTLVPVTSARPPDAGRLRLALRDITDNQASPKPNTKSFLASLVTAHAFTVDVNAPLDTLSTDDSVLFALGMHASQAAGKAKPTGPGPKPPPPDANVDMNDDGKNESVVQSMAATGQVKLTELIVREQPTTNGKPHPVTLKRGDKLPVMGKTGDWYLIDHAGVRGYVAKTSIEIV
jgi:hypothetical protein